MNAKKWMVGMMATLCMGGLTALTAEIDVSADLASAYVFRGVTFNDGWVLQPGVEFGGLPVPLTVGIWANLDLDDYDKTLERGQFSEIDFTVAYALPRLVAPVGWSLGYTEYTYPMSGAEADRELKLGLELDIPLGPERAVTPGLDLYYGVDGGIQRDWYAEFRLGQAWPLLDSGVSLTLDGALGFSRPDDGDRGFSHFTVSGGVGYGIVTATLTYVGRLDDAVLPDAVPTGVGVDGGGPVAGYDTEWIFSIGAAMSF